MKHISPLNPCTWAVLLVSLCCASGEPFTLTGRVVEITDGDTIKISTAGNAAQKVRLAGIDAPEWGQPFGAEAKQQLKIMISGKNVVVEYEKYDEYGRILGMVRTDKLLVNQQLVLQGLAWHYPKYSTDSLLVKAQEHARGMGVGLWGTRNPVPPWRWKLGERSPGSKPKPPGTREN